MDGQLIRSTTIKFNIGGRHFEVSRDLIEQRPGSMLGRMISDTWQRESEKPIFVDRDGDIFAQVLNYLRYGSIVLPVNMPKEMFLRDLDYYGIDYVGDDEAIKDGDKVVAGLKEEVNRLKEMVSSTLAVMKLLRMGQVVAGLNEEVNRLKVKEEEIQILNQLLNQIAVCRALKKVYKFAAFEAIVEAEENVKLLPFELFSRPPQYPQCQSSRHSPRQVMCITGHSKLLEKYGLDWTLSL